jgi:hypothetical protein
VPHFPDGNGSTLGRCLPRPTFGGLPSLFSVFPPSHCGFIADRGRIDWMEKLTVELVPAKAHGFTARLHGIPVYGQGKTEGEAVVDLRRVLQAYITAVGIEEAASRLNPPAPQLLRWFLDPLAERVGPSEPGERA